LEVILFEGIGFRVLKIKFRKYEGQSIGIYWSAC